jgi:hypothetical protein
MLREVSSLLIFIEQYLRFDDLLTDFLSLVFLYRDLLTKLLATMKKFLFLLGALLFLSIGVQAQETPFVDGDLIIMLEKGHNPEKVLTTFAQHDGQSTGITLERELSHLSNIYLFSIDYTAVDQVAVLERIQQYGWVRAAQFNHFVSDRATLPNDPQIGTQWHHVDASDNDIDSDLAWDITTGGTTANGDEIVVCVIEGGGSNYNHTDLIGNHWTNSLEIDGNGIDDDANGYTDDYNGWNAPANNDNIPGGGHGTSVSGMIGAVGDNNNGGAGVNWDVKIMQVVVGSLTESNVIAAYNYPYDMRNIYNTTGGASGAFVVSTNASWGIDNANPASYPVWCAYYDDLGSVGILNCGATANNNVNIDVVGDMPTGCGSDYMVAVTATNSSDVRTFSGYGINSIDLGAPGEAVWLPSGTTGYGSTSGTSFASPCVAGAIALMYSAPCADIAALALSSPQIAADQMLAHLYNGVDPVANLATEVATGGRLNVRNSIDLILGSCGPLPACDPLSLSLATACYYDGASVLAEIELDVTMSEAFCTVQTVCYSTGGGPVTCDDLVLLGINFNNANTYTIQGLASNTLYDVYYTTTDGTSATESILTPDCISEIPGCTDTLASNYNASATIDDGSCIYPCENVTFTIDTDCWGGEVSWELIHDATATVIASVAGGTYGNQQTFTWSGCLDFGCYTFNIYDSFGDGLAGIASGCAVNGDYNMTSDDNGTIIFTMGAPNYGSQATHTFCLPSVSVPGCTEPAACNYDSGANSNDGSCDYSCYGCTDSLACNYDSSVTIDDGSCDFACYGCTNSLACNYDSTSTMDDGSCCIGNCITIDMTDSFGDGWNNGTYDIYDGGGALVVSGTLPGGSIGSDFLCLPDGCYTMDVGGGDFDSEIGWTLNGINAGPLSGGAPVTGISFSAGSTGCVPGCIDTAACNYNSGADLDDGSCTYPDACGVCGGGGTVAGCTDTAACNFNSAADCNDGSCQYLDACGVCGGTGTIAGCTDISACNFNAAADCNDGTCQYLDACGVCGGAGTLAGCTDVSACNFNSAADCNDGTCQYLDACGVCGGSGIVAGCTDSNACNFNSIADCDDGTCTYPDACGVCGGSGTIAGCTDTTACNYNALADCDDASCNYSTCVCPLDLNGDGQITIPDLLIFLANYGCSGTCTGDFDMSGMVDTGDLLLFLSGFGQPCP